MSNDIAPNNTADDPPAATAPATPEPVLDPVPPPVETPSVETPAPPTSQYAPLPPHLIVALNAQRAPATQTAPATPAPAVDRTVGRPPSPAQVVAMEQAREAADPAYHAKMEKLRAAEAAKEARQAQDAAEYAARKEREAWQRDAIAHARIPQSIEEARRLRNSAKELGQDALARHYDVEVRRLEQHEFDRRNRDQHAAVAAGNVVLDPTLPRVGAGEVVFDASAPVPAIEVVIGETHRYERQPVQPRNEKRKPKRGHKQPTTDARSKNKHIVHAWTMLVAGSTPAAIILAYVRYWLEPRSTKDSTDGPRTHYADAEHYWVRGSIREFADETGLTVRQVQRAVDSLLDEGILIRRDPQSTVDPEPRECLLRVAENMHDAEPTQRVRGLDLRSNTQYYRLDPAAIWRTFWGWVQIEADGGALPSSTPAAAETMYAACLRDVGSREYEVDAGGWYRSAAQTFFRQDAVSVKDAHGRYIHVVPLAEEWVTMHPVMVRARNVASADEILVMLTLIGRENAKRKRKWLRFDLSRFTLAELAAITGIRDPLTRSDRTRHARLQRLLTSLARKKHIIKNTVRQTTSPDRKLEAGWRSLVSVSISPHRLAAFVKTGLLVEEMTPEEAEDATADYRIRHAREDAHRRVRGSRSGSRRVSELGKTNQSDTAPMDGRRWDQSEHQYVPHEPVYCPATGQIVNAVETDRDCRRKQIEHVLKREQHTELQRMLDARQR